MTIAVAQMKIEAGNPCRNAETMIQQISEAKRHGADLIIFPEMAICGLLIGDLASNRAFVGECQDMSPRIAAASDDIAVVYGNIEFKEGHIRNVVHLAHNGEDGILEVPLGRGLINGAYQPFSVSSESQVYNLPVDGKVLRIGFLLGDWRNLPLPYAPADVDLIVDLSLTPLQLDMPEFIPRVEGRQLLKVNGYGLQNSGKANYIFAGGSSYYGVSGELIARADLFREGVYIWSRAGGEIAPHPTGDELLGEALVTGVREFMQLIKASRVVIGVSGGIDSALAACIYSRALGPENVYLISMPSHFNSEQTKSLAAKMAAGLGTNYATIPINDSYLALKDQLEATDFTGADGPAFNLQLNDTVLENVQARERGRILAACAAALSAVFTCNSNKTEMTVGYATFYGDLAGAFAAQADLWKYQVYQACRYFQSLYPQVPLDEIAAIRPSAELSEKQDVTKGLGDPLIYKYHDYLLRFWVERDFDLASTLAMYRTGRLEEEIGCPSGIINELFDSDEEFCRDCEYWWKMYRGVGVAKRIQAPPLLVLSSRPFGEEKQQAQGIVYRHGKINEIKSDLCNRKSERGKN